jgi:hypothetical protein
MGQFSGTAGAFHPRGWSRVPYLAFSPALYSCLQNHRIYQLYFELTLLEDEMASSHLNQTEGYIERLKRLEDRASRLSLPKAYQPLVYALRLHIGMVRQRVEKPPG